MRLSSIGICTLIFLLGCRQNEVQYQLAGFQVGNRNVLVEEFSGARCPNCPQGTLELDNLKELYDERLVILTIHAGDFAFTYPESRFDFTTPEGDELLRFLGNPLGYPSAVINRRRDPASGSYQAFSTKWPSLISESLQESPVLTLNIDVDYDSDTRILNARIQVFPEKGIEEETRLTVLLKEDHLVDPQADRAAESGRVDHYDHKNVLRKILSDIDGDTLGDQMQAFESSERSFFYTLPREDNWWKEEDISIVAFVTGANGAVLQVTERNILP